MLRSTGSRPTNTLKTGPPETKNHSHNPWTTKRDPLKGASALFQVVAQRYLKTSIVITSNRGVGAWGEILGDTTIAAAMLDRLLHRSVVLNLDGDSYRLRDHHARTDTLRRTTTGTRQPLP